MDSANGFPPSAQIHQVRIRKGKSVTVKADTVIWLPDDVRTVRLLLLTKTGEGPKHGPEPLSDH